MQKGSETRWSGRAERYSLKLTTVLFLVIAGQTAVAQQDIYRCVAEDGSIIFQETPCPESVDDTEVESDESPDDPPAGDDFFDFVNPYDQQVDAVEEMPLDEEAPLPPPVSPDRAECEKITRDAIDAIDLEMRRGYSPEDGEQYKAELLELTQQLRACKQL